MKSYRCTKTTGVGVSLPENSAFALQPSVSDSSSPAPNLQSPPSAPSSGAFPPASNLAPPTSNPRSFPPTSNLESRTSNSCHHIDARGHRCNMLVADPDSTLCVHHVRQALKLQRRQDAAAARELLDGVEDFSSAYSVNYFLGSLLQQLARKRIDRRDAIALAYISQLLLNSLTALDRQDEAERDAEGCRELYASIMGSQTKRDPTGDSAGTSDASDRLARDPSGAGSDFQRQGG